MMASTMKEAIEADLLKLWLLKDQSRLGLRCVKISGIYLDDDLTRIGHLVRLRDALPSDAALWNDDGRLYRFAYSAGVVCDRIMLVFASREWPVLAEGDLIPELEIKWAVQTRTVIHVDKRFETVKFVNEDENFVDVVIERK